jgi:hypothetical protein
MKEERLSCNGLSRAMKHGCTTMNLQENVKTWSGNTLLSRKFKSVHSASKVMLMLSWDFNGPIIKDYQVHGKMVSSGWYCVVLEELKPAICSEHKGMQTNGVVLHHTNA